MNIFKELVVARKQMRNDAQSDGRHTFLRTGIYRGHVIEVGSAVDDLAVEIAVAGCGEQAGTALQREGAAGAGRRTVHPITGQVGFRISVPVQDDALIARSTHHSSWSLNPESVRDSELERDLKANP